jgi:hypothetical protein
MVTQQDVARLAGARALIGLRHPPGFLPALAIQAESGVGHRLEPCALDEAVTFFAGAVDAPTQAA